MLQKLIKSNVLLSFQQKHKLLSFLKKASKEDLLSLNRILNSSNEKLRKHLNDNVNSENIDGLLMKIQKIKLRVNKFEEKTEEEKEDILEQELLSKIDQE